MPSNESFLQYVLEQTSDSDAVSYRKMMGEYVLYYNGKVIGGIYDDRLLVKPTAAAKRLLPDAAYELPYEGAKPLLSVAELDDKALLNQLFREIAIELSDKKKK